MTATLSDSKLSRLDIRNAAIEFAQRYMIGSDAEVQMFVSTDQNCLRLTSHGRILLSGHGFEFHKIADKTIENLVLQNSSAIRSMLLEMNQKFPCLWQIQLLEKEQLYVSSSQLAFDIKMIGLEATLKNLE